MQAICSSVLRRSSGCAAARAAVRLQAPACTGLGGARAARALAHRGPTALLRVAPELRLARRGVSAVVASSKATFQDPHATLGVPPAASWEVIEGAHQQLVMDSLPEYEFDDCQAEALAARLDLLIGAYDALAARAPL